MRNVTRRNAESAERVGLSKRVETASLDAVGESLGPIDCVAFGHVTVQLVGVFSASVLFEGSNDGVNWTGTTMASLGGSRGSQFSTVGLFSGPLLFRWFRARCLTYISGAMELTAVFSTFPGPYPEALLSDGSGSGQGVLLGGYNGATFDRLRSITALAGDAYAGTGLLAVAEALYNGTTFDRERPNVRGTHLSSAARTATTNGPDTINHNGRGLIVHFDVTAGASAIDTVTLEVQVKDLTSGKYTTITAFPAVQANECNVYVIYPGAVETSAVPRFAVQGVPSTREFRVRVVHITGTAVTYSASVEVIL